ncbi:hypothetical protein PYR66_09915 [Klebsiella aerogenes]|nr:hypothetical protein PYR66_09915 [Klebsiella aerogenes]
MWDALSTWFGSMFTDSTVKKGGKAVMSSNMGESVKSVLGSNAMGGVMRGLMAPGPVAHAQSTAYHFQTNANPVSTLKTGFDEMKLGQDGVNQGFNSLKNLF